MFLRQTASAGKNVSEARVKRSLLLSALLFLIVAILCFVYQFQHPSCPECDDQTYLSVARFFLDGTPITDTLYHVRTYGYPAMLAVLMAVSHYNTLVLSALVACLQIAAYGLSVWILYVVVRGRYSESVAMLVAFALFANLLLLPYLGIELTDGLSVAMAIGAVSLMLEAYSEAHRASLSKLSTLLFFVGLIVGFGVMIRPGNLHWIPACALSVLMICIRRRPQGAQAAAAVVLSVLLGFGLAVMPQFLLNTAVFHRHTFLPTYDLSGLQFDLGVKWLKYATHVTTAWHGYGMPYVNPWYLDGMSSTATLHWYVDNPVRGLKTAALHLFGALDFDYLFCYIHGGSPWYRPLLFIYCHTVLFWGVAGYLRLAKQAMVTGRNSVETYAAILILTYVASWAAVYAFTAVENRFALPIITLCLPLAFWQIRKVTETQNSRSLQLMMFASYLACAGYFSHFLDLNKING
jgi:hypothetical protein